ncbi:MAG: hypothetical protein ABEK16_01350 [Candidatus Nanohalobium sp.]
MTTEFVESFIREQSLDEDMELVFKENSISVIRDGFEVTGRFSPTEFEEAVADVFGLTVQETIDFRDKFDAFKEEGSRREVSDSRLMTVEKYRKNYGSESISEIADNLRVSGEDFSLGHDVWNFLETPEADIIAENAANEIDEILEAESDVIEEQIGEEFSGKYREAAEQAYEKLEEDISEIAGLAEISGYRADLGMFDTFNWLKEKQENPNWQDEIDTDELRRRLESEVETQRRSKTLDALESQAQQIAKKHYRNITGEEPDELDKDELYAVRAHIMTQRFEDLEILEDIIKYGEESYFRESSPSYDQISSLEYSELEVLKNGLGKEVAEIGGREFEIYVASPIEGLRYGDEFDTCHSITWEEDYNTRNSGAIRRSASLTSPIIYVKDGNGEIIGRDRIDLREDAIVDKSIDTLISSSKSYSGLENRELNSQLKEAIEEYEEDMRLQIGYPRRCKRADIFEAIINSDVYDEWLAPGAEPPA